MSLITIPNRPAGTDVRAIEQILADFDAITNGINGNLDSSNFSPATNAGLMQTPNNVGSINPAPSAPFRPNPTRPAWIAFSFALSIGAGANIYIGPTTPPTMGIYSYTGPSGGSIYVGASIIVPAGWYCMWTASGGASITLCTQMIL